MSEINYHVLQKAGLRRYFESLQMVLMGRFCNFSKSKTVNCHMQARGTGKPVSGAQGFCPDRRSEAFFIQNSHSV